ncbi:hypothetical protein KDA14_04375, partial [Candidatus Saccharibacteria bacterium]|nr:hypothetical protein [Candidatus Saccharibacteria bacterium]
MCDIVKKSQEIEEMFEKLNDDERKAIGYLDHDDEGNLLAPDGSVMDIDTQRPAICPKARAASMYLDGRFRKRRAMADKSELARVYGNKEYDDTGFMRMDERSIVEKHAPEVAKKLKDMVVVKESQLMEMMSSEDRKYFSYMEPYTPDGMYKRIFANALKESENAVIFEEEEEDNGKDMTPSAVQRGEDVLQESSCTDDFIDPLLDEELLFEASLVVEEIESKKYESIFDYVPPPKKPKKSRKGGGGKKSQNTGSNQTTTRKRSRSNSKHTIPKDQSKLNFKPNAIYSSVAEDTCEPCDEETIINAIARKAIRSVAASDSAIIPPLAPMDIDDEDMQHQMNVLNKWKKRNHRAHSSSPERKNMNGDDDIDTVFGYDESFCNPNESSSTQYTKSSDVMKNNMHVTAKKNVSSATKKKFTSTSQTNTRQHQTPNLTSLLRQSLDDLEASYNDPTDDIHDDDRSYEEQIGMYIEDDRSNTSSLSDQDFNHGTNTHSHEINGHGDPEDDESENAAFANFMETLRATAPEKTQTTTLSSIIAAKKTQTSPDFGAKTENAKPLPFVPIGSGGISVTLPPRAQGTATLKHP